jgi:glycosyltransferase involved in cell wall biosynthesis
MKILIVQPYGQVPGHPAIYTKLLVQGIISNDINEISVLNFSGFCEEWPRDNRIKQIQIAKNDSKWVKLGFRIFGENLWHRYFSSFITGLYAMSMAKDYDVVHFIDSVWFVLYFVWRLKGSPKNIVLTLVGTQEIKPDFSKKRKLKTWLEINSLKLWLKNKLKFITHSENVKEWVNNNFRLSNKFDGDVIPWGIEVHKNLADKNQSLEILAVKNPQKTMFLFFGLIDPRKNIEEFIESIKNLPKSFNIIIAGPPSPKGYEHNIQNLANKVGWEELVDIRPQFIPSQQIMHYFRAADALILNYGSFPNASGVLAHAIEYNVPVIASDFGQIGQFVREHSLGLVFEPHNKESISNTVIKFLETSESKKKEWSINICDFGKKFSWRAIGERHLSFYSNIPQSC